MKTKKLTVFFLCVLSACMIMACAKTNTLPDQESQGSESRKQKIQDSHTEDDSAADSFAKESAASAKESGFSPEESPASDNDNMPHTASGTKEWDLAYLKYLDELEYGDSCTYSFIYVDEDDIPELVINTGYEAGGCLILTWHDNVIDALQTSRLYFNYIEKGNLLCNSEGHMGYYYDDVYTIRNQKWTYVAGGTYEDGEDGPHLDEHGDFVFVYKWNGEEVTETEYTANLNAVYPDSQRTEPEKYYIPSEMRSILETGETASANHHYEFIIQDMTWTNARISCEAKGGYLATITSWEEWERIQEQILSEGKGNIVFWVGAKDICWLEPGIENGYNMLSYYNALFQFWLEGEPSYTGKTEDGGIMDEDCVALFYHASDGKFYLNDVPDDILSAAPSYKGKVGYICEYDLP